MRRHPWIAAGLLTVLAVGLAGEGRPLRGGAPEGPLPLPELQADPRIPTLREVVGGEWGEGITRHEQIQRYIEALAHAAPDRTRLTRYGSSYEGRRLSYLVITSPANRKRLERIRQDNLLLSDPRRGTRERVRALFRTAPAIVWLAYSIHGNECSPADAALVTAYHLLADRRAATRRWLEQVVVIIDPLQNPDGRARFVHSFQKNRGAFVQSHPRASEHTEPWPGGRTNHYYFDMNRDWFLQSQQETQGKVAAYLEWQPQIFVDAHEMGRNRTYYFTPPMDPVISLLLPRQHEWLFRIGRHQARRFDQRGFRYTTREMFDAFYPGYGSQWPTMQGAIGILWEQAGVRGLVIDRDDETKLHYAESVLHHYVSGLATIEVAAENREALLRDYYQTQQQSIQLGHDGPVRHYFLLEGTRPDRAARLARVLAANRIEVRRFEKPVPLTASDIREEEPRERTIPAGSYHVPVAQPAGRLIRALLDREVTMGERFIKRQLERNQQYLPDEIYDVTAWSLPLAFGARCLASEQDVDVPSRPLSEPPPVEVPRQPPQVAYLVPGTDGALAALCQWLRSGVRVHVTDRSMKLDGRHYAPGTLVLFVHGNSDQLPALVRDAAQRFHLKVGQADTGFVDEGAHLGGPHVPWVRPPKILLPVGRPTSYSVGHTWYLFDQQLEYPTTRVEARNLPRIDLNDFNVLVLPHGYYGSSDGFDEELARRIRSWVSQGGTLALVRGAAQWAMGEKIGLLPTSRLQKPVEAAQTTGTRQQPGAEEEKPTMVSPDAAPGVFLRASVFADHWVTYGYQDHLDVFYTGSLILKPLVPTSGRNLVTLAPQEDLLVSGFCWPKTLELLAETPYATYQAVGEGHVVAFADDPNYRAMYPCVQRLFVNAVLFGPGH